MPDRTAVIGAGPAGLAAALEAARHSQVTVLEKNAEPGRKLLLTGSGQCNLTHDGDYRDLLPCYGEAGNFLRQALAARTPGDVIRFFEDSGVPCIREESGKVFPSSRSARDVLNALLERCRELKVSFSCGSAVKEIIRNDQGFTLLLRCGGSFEAQRVILTAGGMSYPATGSSGDGYRLARSLGHTIVPPVPALDGITLSHHPWRELSGLTLRPAEIRVFRQGALVLKHRDDLLITERGLSGPVIINRCGRMHDGDEIEADLSAGRWDAAETASLIRQNGSAGIASALHRLGLPRRMASVLAAEAGLDPKRKAAEIRKTDLAALIKAATSTRFTIASAGSFSRAAATAGGVSLREVDPQRMESRLVKGLFFAGEVLDIDGETGGYNLQAAWSTGYIAGRSCLSEENLIG